MKAVAYCRSRPGEPTASELALRRHREAVQRELEEGYELVAEFTDREGEVGSEGYPTYIAAVRAASAHSSGDLLDVMLIVASQAGIGTGEPFQMPSVEGAGGILWSLLQVRSMPAPPEIGLLAGAPGPLCLYANCCPHQLDTLVYLGNAGPQTLTDVVVTTDTILLGGALLGEIGGAGQHARAALGRAAAGPGRAGRLA